MARKTVLSLLLLLVLLLAGVAGAGWWWISRPFPPTTGTMELAGLDGPVEIRRDRWGVPHIEATTMHDLYFAQGVVHAQDRLWQMEFQRRVGLGRLAEVMGEPALAADRFMRTLGIAQAARRDWEALDGETQAALQAYADGVNRYVATMPHLPVEYQLLGIEWEPWEPLHTLAWWKVMQWKLSGNWEEELFRARLLDTVDAETAALIMGDDAPLEPELVHPIGQPDLASLRARMAVTSIGLAGTTGHGSNGWVLAGDRSATGRPLLANDSHLGPRMPATWYLIGLQGPAHHVTGASMPGSPAVFIGHNEQIAWSMAALTIDSQDLYIERLDETGTHYAYQGEMQSLRVRDEQIRVKDGADVRLAVRETRHGPLLNDLIDGLERPVALRWRATAEPSRLMAAVLALNRATDRESFLDALRLWDAPAQHFLYAGQDGDIGYVAAGDLPIRPAAGGRLPQPGWTGEWAWQGTVPFDDLPRQWNPPEGYIVAADRPLIPGHFPYYTGTGRAAAHRTQRIRSLIEAKGRLTVDDVETMQRDMISLPARTLIPRLVAVESDNIIVQRAQAQLDTWNLRVAGELPGAGIYQVAHGFIVRNLLADTLEEEALVDQYLNFTPRHLRLVERLLAEPDHPLWDDTTTTETERRDEILHRALLDTRQWLGRRYGDVPHEWFWDNLHTVTFTHPLGDRVPLRSLFDRSARAVGGDRTTVNTIGFSYGAGYEADSLPVYRQIVDVGAWENSRWLIATGQSGLPFHRHYDDMIDRWERVDLLPMGWTEAQRQLLQPAP